MKNTALALTSILVLASGTFGPANAASDKPVLVPGYEAAKDLPGAHEFPDPRTVDDDLNTYPWLVVSLSISGN